MTGLIGFLLIIVGIISVCWPYAIWHMQLGWKLKDAEPSDNALAVNRVSGVIFLIIGLFIILSSCSNIGTSDWPERFKKQLSEGQVQEIRIGMVDPVILTEEDKQAVIQMILDAELRPFEPATMYGASDTGEFVFLDQTRVELVFFGQTGGIELHPNDAEENFEVMSEDLTSWSSRFLDLK